MRLSRSAIRAWWAFAARSSAPRGDLRLALGLSLGLRALRSFLERQLGSTPRRRASSRLAPAAACGLRPAAIRGRPRDGCRLPAGRARRPAGRLRLPPQELLVGARVAVRVAAAHLDDPIGQALDEVAVVRDEDQRAAVILERVEQDVLRVEVEMVGRLVEQQRVRRTQQHARHRQPRALAARQHAGLLVDVVAREEESAEDVADGRHHVVGRAGPQRVVDGEIGVEPRRLVLREVLHHHLVSLAPLTRVRRLDAGEHAHQGGLPGPVRSDDRDAVAPLDVQARAPEDDGVAVGLVRVLQLEHHPAAL